MKKIFKIIGVIIIVIVLYVLIYIVGVTINDKEIPNDLYIKMSEINNNKSLIGLSEEEVIELLGKPVDKLVDTTHLKNYTYYTYEAGYTFKSFLGNTYDKKYYDFEVLFDPDGIVKYTYIHQIV